MGLPRRPHGPPPTTGVLLLPRGQHLSWACPVRMQEARPRRATHAVPTRQRGFCPPAAVPVSRGSGRPFLLPSAPHLQLRPHPHCVTHGRPCGRTRFQPSQDSLSTQGLEMSPVSSTAAKRGRCPEWSSLPELLSLSFVRTQGDRLPLRDQPEARPSFELCLHPQDPCVLCALPWSVLQPTLDNAGLRQAGPQATDSLRITLDSPKTSQSSLGIRLGLVPGPLWVPKSADARVPSTEQRGSTQSALCLGGFSTMHRKETCFQSRLLNPQMGSPGTRRAVCLFFEKHPQMSTVQTCVVRESTVFGVRITTSAHRACRGDRLAPRGDATRVSWASL